MRKPVYAICEQQRRRSDCTSTLISIFIIRGLDSIIPLCFYIRNFKPLASFLSWAGRFESYLVENPKDRFSCDGAHIMYSQYTKQLMYSQLEIKQKYTDKITHKKTCLKARARHCVNIFWGLLMFAAHLWLFFTRKCCKNTTDTVDRVKRIWYLTPMRAAKVQASLRIRAVSPEPSLLA